MSTTSPQKRRAQTFMRTTRSMARIPDAVDFGERSSSTRLFSTRPAAAPSSSSQAPSLSPRKARASQAMQVESFDPDSPNTSLTACMESPKKGRFDDFEFELENSNPEVPTRRRRIAPPRESSTSPSASVGLPRSKTSATLARSGEAGENTLRASRKENSPTAQTEELRVGASPVKPQTALPRGSRLHGPTPSLRTSSSAAPSDVTSTRPVKAEDASASAHPLASVPSSDRLLFGTSDVKLGSNTERNPFTEARKTNSLAMLGEQRHSPVKRFQAKSAFIISSPDRPDRKPINLLELKPSPGKAQRGIFRHNSAVDEEDDDDWDMSADNTADNTADEIRLVKGPGPRRQEAPSKREKLPSSSGSVASESSSASSRTQSLPRSTTTIDVKHKLSTETSDALASLEASLAKLKAKTREPPSSMAAMIKKKDDSSHTDSTLKRELGGGARPFGMTSSRTQIFRKPPVSGSESSFSIRSSVADQSSDSSVFKRPSGRVSALAKSRESSSEFRASSNGSLVSSKSMMSFGAPRLPGYSELGGRPTAQPVMMSSRTSSLEVASSDSRVEEEAAQEEEQARVAEAKRQAELKAAKRRSMTPALSSGMPPPAVRREAEPARPSTTQRREPEPVRSSAGASARIIGARSSSSHAPSSLSSSSQATAPTAEPTEAELAEARKAAKAARRRSLYTYVPAKRDDVDGDRSVGNVSSGLVVTDASAPAPRKARFLRGLTVLVDVRDQDGEDASACWIDMLKNAGAKVMVRFGERKLTHIVYKSGRPSTLHSYRALEDPKPHVVGIKWVVACLEQGQKAEESPYLVEVAKQAIFATRRRSLMAPKQMPSSASIIRELPEEKLKDVEEARRRLLAHAPAVSSPLRRRISSRTILASRLAQTSLTSSPSRSDAQSDDSTRASATDQAGCPDKDDPTDEALLEVYRKRVGSVLSPRTPTVLA
ncbi:BRCT domain protein [Kalmanozyma brasiliensis GHG001]|uniref:BRCT domain-containing protein n=1 Tax=Kalmanozyma brasiliensis (strain GHG001) TaxID=1365824 RepID=V5ECA2_KALBG|nr:BRCT domain protein [Kalmanozyma brasiliensis GHG001]EST08026.1 BRCT domain protein [Kalmanozyma brasiliensis GHG001]